tara:strand:- start:330 stop:1178 length:849 start_codon:yes stop_codon:yes gene_type:complete
MKIKITPDTLDEKRKKRKKKKKSGGKKDACYYKVKSRYSVWPSAYASGALVKCRKVGAKNWGTGGKKKKKKTNESIDLLETVKDAEEAIIDTLEKEGGAAGLDPLEKAIEDIELPDDFDIEDFLEKMKNVEQHKKGDYIEMTGLEEVIRHQLESVLNESLRDWFGKSKSKGKKGRPGWVQAGGKYDGKPCARQPGQKTTPKCVSRSKYNNMSKKERESAARRKRRKDPNQPKKRGAAKPTYVNTDPKRKKKKKTNESAAEYVYGVKNPRRVANIYKIKVVKK